MSVEIIDLQIERNQRGVKRLEALSAFTELAYGLAFVRVQKKDPADLNYRVLVPRGLHMFLGNPKVADAESDWWPKGVVPMRVLQYARNGLGE